MTKLHQRYDRYGQNPWLDNLTRPPPQPLGGDNDDQ
jgi:hypothetical protein